MKGVVKHVLVVLSLMMASVSQADDYMEGAEYLRLASPQKTGSPDKIEVVELFWYS